MNKSKKKMILCLFLVLLFLIPGCSKENGRAARWSKMNLEQAKELLSESSSRASSAPTDTHKIFYQFQKKTLEPSDGEGCHLLSFRYPSLKELILAFSENTLDNKELSIVRGYAKNNGLESYVVLDLGSLYEPIFPQGTESGTVSWAGSNNVRFLFETSEFSGFATFHRPSFEQEFKQEYISCTENPNIRSVGEKMIGDRNATMTYIVTSKELAMSIVRYQVSTNESTVFITEYYMGHLENGPSEKDIPYIMWMFYVDNETAASFTFSRIEGRPSLEWIASFGAKKFTDFGDLPETVTVPVTDAAQETVTETAKP